MSDWLNEIRENDQSIQEARQKAQDKQKLARQEMEKWMSQVAGPAFKRFANEIRQVRPDAHLSEMPLYKEIVVYSPERTWTELMAKLMFAPGDKGDLQWEGLKREQMPVRWNTRDVTEDAIYNLLKETYLQNIRSRRG